VSGPSYQGGALDWLTPFSLFTGFGLLVAYAMLGSTWLIMKTEGALHRRMSAIAVPITLVQLAVIGVVSLWTPLAHAEIAARWFNQSNFIFFAPVPILVLATTWLMLRVLHRQTQFAAFPLALLLLFLGYSGLIISLWPHIIPPSVSIWQAASPPQSMGFTLVGALFIIPFILVYTSWSYYVFRGKVKVGEGYH